MNCIKRPKVIADHFLPDEAGQAGEAVTLTRIRPELNECRFYHLEVWPDLFGRALLFRQWGRIGTEGQRRLDPHPDAEAAAEALAVLAAQKRRTGYQDRAA